MNITALMDKFLPEKTTELLRAISVLSSDNGFQIYLVGGIVRDLLLGRANLDIDIAVDGDGQAFALIVAGEMNGSVVMHGRFGTSVVILPGKTRVDIATARTESYSRPGALPDVEFSSIRYDLKRRDFSINAMAASLNTSNFGEVTDYFGGLSDLETGVIRSLYPESFIDDPTRILRAFRFEASLGFAIEKETEKRLAEAARGGYLRQVSGSRLRKEIFAIAEGRAVAEAFIRMGAMGIWDALTPSLLPGQDAYRTIGLLSEAEDALRQGLKHGYKRRFAILTALLMDSGPDAAMEFCGIIELSRFRASRLVAFASGHDEIFESLSRQVSPSVLYGLLRDMPEESLAVLWASGNSSVRNAVSDFTRIRKTKPLISGRDLIKWGYQPSKAFASVLGDVFSKQLDGVIRTKAEAKAEAEKGIIGYNSTA